MTKIRAFVTIIAEGVDGKAIKIEPGQVGDVKVNDIIREMMAEGQIERAGKDAEDTSRPASELRKGGPKRTQLVAPSPAATKKAADKKAAAKGKSTEEPKAKRGRKNQDEVFPDVDTEFGEDGKGFDADED